jgi:hypothetical protein
VNVRCSIVIPHGTINNAHVWVSKGNLEISVGHFAFIIISLSGVIVIGAIITAKYFHQDSDVKTGVLMNYIASRILKKRGNKVMPLEDKEETLTGKDFSCVLDYLFLRGTYLAIALKQNHNSII